MEFIDGKVDRQADRQTEYAACMHFQQRRHNISNSLTSESNLLDCKWEPEWLRKVKQEENATIQMFHFCAYV
jgi:hypothetical protein